MVTNPVLDSKAFFIFLIYIVLNICMLAASNTTTEGSEAVRKRRYIFDARHDKVGIKKRFRRVDHITATLADFGEGLPQGTTFASQSCSNRRDNCVSNTFKTCPECVYTLTMPTT